MRPLISMRSGITVLLGLLIATTATADDGSAEAPFRVYSVFDGLSQSDVLDVAQDQAGYLWVATARGLNRYDGKEFEHYTIASGLPRNSLSAVHVSAENSVWAGDAIGGITEIRTGRVRRKIEPIAEKSNPILDIENINARLFAVVEDFGIVEVSTDNRNFGEQKIIGGRSAGVTSLEIVGEDVWVESATGLYRLVFGSGGGLELVNASIRNIHVDSMGTLWVADQAGVVGTWRDGHFDAYAEIDSKDEIVSIVMDRNGLMWIATVDALFSFNSHAERGDNSIIPVRKYDAPGDISSLLVDAENSLWMSSGSGLVRFLGHRFENYRLRVDANPVTVWTIGEDKYGRFWFGTKSGLLMRRTDESLLIVGAEHGIPAGEVRDVISDNAGALWVGLKSEGLYRLDVDTMMAEFVAGTDGLEILDIAVAADSTVWFSTMNSGVGRFDPSDEALQIYAAPSNTSVYSLDVWDDGSVWYMADNVGIVKLVPNGKGGYTESIDKGPNSVGKRLYNQIRLLAANKAWIATEDGGLFLYEDGQLENFARGTPLSDQTVYLVQDLANGTVVVGGEQGLYQFVPGEPGFSHYNSAVGFTALETNVHSTFLDSAGYLWIGTIDGATRMDVSHTMEKALEPKPRIVRAESRLTGRQLIDDQVVEPEHSGIHIEFAAISLLSPRGIQYSYKLIGDEAQWGVPTTNREVSYPRILPGSYEFVVRARYPGGDWSTDVAKRRFTVSPFFWQRPLFIIMVLAAIGLAFRGAMLFRTRNIQWMNESLRAQVEDRTRSIEDARQKLLITNERLSAEAAARAEIETRFRRAFINAPIGMGLLDAEGVLIDANPALKSMFWASAQSPAKIRFSELLTEDEQEQFSARYLGLIHSEFESLDEHLTCINDSGDVLDLVANLSTVRDKSGKFLNSVLQIQDVTESLKQSVQLKYQASYDELTGFLNRRAFEGQLEKAWSSGAKGGKNSYLMFMDLDQFKVVNDTSGHGAGDKLLQEVSRILQDSVRGDDIVGRLGGDEFGVILWECPTIVAQRIAESIRARIEAFRFHWDVETYRVGVSIGGLPIDPDVGDINELQQLADAACYAAKEAGRNRVHMVDGDKDSARVHRGQVRWVQRISEAMEQNRFAIYAQQIRPIVENSDEPERLEILLRLRDPESRKLIPPGAFMPAVERYGLSVELDKWVIKSLIDTLFVHNAFEAEHRSYWINLSASSARDKRFADFLKDAISRSPLPPGTINFEIAESAVIRGLSEARELMVDLRDMGCQFALDDFGSGLSSFAYLKNLPVDFLKIDGMFIRDLINDKADRIFVKSIIDIAHTLNIKTIAELVETPESLKLVGELGAEYAQGFVIGRPFVLAPRFPRTSGSEAAIFQAKAG